MQANDGDIQTMFGTPVLVKPNAGSPEMNAGLIDFLNDLKRRDPKLRKTSRSGIGGWRTSDAILDAEVPAIQELKGVITTAIGQVLATADHRLCKGVVNRLYGWANINRSGDYNTIHSHPTSHWSGIYYVAADGAVDPEAPLSGVVEFQDPRGAVHAQPFPGFDFARKLRLVPEPGLILVFPGWLLHMVHPCRGPAERISFAFNSTYE